MTSVRNRIAALVAAGAVLLGAAVAQSRNPPSRGKNTTAKPDALVEYLDHVSARAIDPAPTTAGSLWSDNGRLANMVADYKASRVGDLVTISVAQNLSATSTGNVSTNRSFTASSGISAWPGSKSRTGI